MRILFFLRYSRDQASSRVRGFLVAETLRRAGIQCDILFGYSKNVSMRFLFQMFTYDVIYFQKRYAPLDRRLNALARFFGKITLFDIDDAPATVNHNRVAEENARAMMRRSSAIIVGSHTLLNYAKRYTDQVFLIPSLIDLRSYQPVQKEAVSRQVTLGWIGNGINYKEDLQMLLAPLERLGRTYPIKLMLIGALQQPEIHQNFRALKNVQVEIIDSIDWKSPMTIPAVISQFDIGLYPLLNNDYNQYKCGFKALEYMAMGIPVVASPVGENRYIITDGQDGFLVAHEKDWEARLADLLEHPEVRQRMGERGKEKVVSRYSLEAGVRTLKGILETLVTTRV